MNGCDAIGPRLSEFADGRLEAAEAAEVREHLAACAACRGLAADLARLAAAARSLGPVQPPDHVWLELAGRIHLDTPAASPPQATSYGAVWQWAGLAAALVVITLAIWVVSGMRGGAPATAPETASLELVSSELALAMDHYERAVEELERLVASGDDSIDSEVADTLARNLGIIDQAIAESRSALVNDPASVPARASLFEALSRKVSVLQATLRLMNDMRLGNPEGAARSAADIGKKS